MQSSSGLSDAVDPLLAFLYVRFDPITASFLYGLVFAIGVMLFVHAVGIVVRRLTGEN